MTTSPEPIDETFAHNPYKPKRRPVGKIGGEELYQLAESTGCMDCFKRMPAGALVVMQKVTGESIIPVCIGMSGLEPGQISFCKRVGLCDEVTCPAIEDGELLKRATRYAAKVRSDEFKATPTRD